MTSKSNSQLLRG